jgi:sugar phosphate isomerase/epimerase
VTEVAVTHERVSVHSISFLDAPLDELAAHWQTLGLRRVSLVDSQLFESELPSLLKAGEYTVESVYHLFGSGRLDREATDAARKGLSRVIDAAATVGARVVYMLTGGRGELTWEQAAEQFCSAVAPCLQTAEQAGVELAIENASSLYADMHIAHSLRDTIAVAEMAGMGICIDLFHCWAEADFAGLVQRALPRTRLIQLSDYILGDRSLPARAVPGDGAIPIESFLLQAVTGGYRYGFDLELIGPRIDREGRLDAARRGCQRVTELLESVGG